MDRDPIRLLAILTALSLFTPSSASLFLYDTRQQYESQPASFGMRFEVGREYAARLQTIENDLYLCNEETAQSESIVVPDDNSPVALLVERGHCSYEQKARVAMSISPVVQYVIVYDSVADENLKTMTATDASGITIGLQFISYTSGLDIHRQLMNQGEDNLKAGGMRVLLDCYTPWLYPNGWVGWIMMLISCFGSFLLCISTGFIRRDGNIIVVGPPGSDYDALLTDEEVDALPEIEYRAENKSAGSTRETADWFEIASCTICLDEYTQGETLKVLPCHHSFHPMCIKPWLTERQRTCPLCKQRVTLPGEEDIEEETEEDENENGDGAVPNLSEASTSSTTHGEIEESNDIARGWFHIPNPFHGWGTRERSGSDDSNEMDTPLLGSDNIV